jgi:hypothetical protein
MRVSAQTTSGLPLAKQCEEEAARIVPTTRRHRLSYRAPRELSERDRGSDSMRVDALDQALIELRETIQ